MTVESTIATVTLTPAQEATYLETNKKILDKLGVSEWHAAGITGKTDVLDIWEKLTEGVLVETGPDLVGIDHANKVKEYFQLFAPDSIVHIRDYRIWAIMNVESEVINMSLTGSAFLGYQSEEQRRADEGILLATSAGNKGRDPYPNLTFSATKEWWTPVTSLHYERAYDHFIKPVYSSSGPNLANGFSGVSGMYLPKAKQAPIGTSFASPSFVGMVFLYRQWYKDRFKKYPSKSNSLAFMRMISKQPDQFKGQNEVVGVGLPHLPKLEWMESNKRMIRTLGEKFIEMEIGNKIAKIYGQTVELDSPPVIINNRTMVPIRFVSEAYEDAVSWEPPNGQHKGKVFIERSAVDGGKVN